VPHEGSGVSKFLKERHTIRDVQSSILWRYCTDVLWLPGEKDIAAVPLAPAFPVQMRDKIHFHLEDRYDHDKSIHGLQSHADCFFFLDDNLLVSHNHGRPKKQNVALCKNSLGFRRAKMDTGITIPRDDILIVTSQPAESCVGRLTVHYHDSYVVKSAEVFFQDASLLTLWATFLAQNVPTNYPVRKHSSVWSHAGLKTAT
jgi:hypothetical protein